MSQVKAEVALNLLKYFRWLVQSYKTTLVNFYIAQKQHVKDSGWFSISGNDSLCKQTSDGETLVQFPGTDYLIFRVCHLGIALLGRPQFDWGLNWGLKTNVLTVFLCGLEYLISKTTSHSHTLVCMEFITSCRHSHIIKLPWITCTKILPACTYNVWFSEYREDEVELTKLHFQSFKSYYHINVIENKLERSNPINISEEPLAPKVERSPSQSHPHAKLKGGIPTTRGAPSPLPQLERSPPPQLERSHWPQRESSCRISHLEGNLSEAHKDERGDHHN